MHRRLSAALAAVTALSLAGPLQAQPAPAKPAAKPKAAAPAKPATKPKAAGPKKPAAFSGAASVFFAGLLAKYQRKRMLLLWRQLVGLQGRSLG